MEVVVAWVVKPCEATPHPSETPQHRGYFRMLKLLIGPFLSSNRLMLTFFSKDEPSPSKRDIQVGNRSNQKSSHDSSSCMKQQMLVMIKTLAKPSLKQTLLSSTRRVASEKGNRVSTASADER